jgi:hypothetical protein
LTQNVVKKALNGRREGVLTTPSLVVQISKSVANTKRQKTGPNLRLVHMLKHPPLFTLSSIPVSLLLPGRESQGPSAHHCTAMPSSSRRRRNEGLGGSAPRHPDRRLRQAGALLRDHAGRGARVHRLEARRRRRAGA